MARSGSRKTIDRGVYRDELLDRLSRPTPRSSIVRLFYTSRPSTIRRFVVSIHVDAVDRATRWTWSHVANESAERIPPLCAHRDAAATVISVVLMLGVEATLLCAEPGPVRGCVTETVSKIWIVFAIHRLSDNRCASRSSLPLRATRLRAEPAVRRPSQCSKSGRELNAASFTRSELTRTAMTRDNSNVHDETR